MSAAGIQYEVADRNTATCYGGIGLIHSLALQCGLVEAINSNVQLLQNHFPYHESDHVLNIAYNAMTDGTCLEDLKRKRADEASLNALGAQRIPDASTAGDFCRRFKSHDDIDSLHAAIDEARRNVWSQQPDGFFTQATVDMDGSIVETTGECKVGMDMSYKGIWGYHPLVIPVAVPTYPALGGFWALVIRLSLAVKPAFPQPANGGGNEARSKKIRHKEYESCTVVPKI